MTQEPGYTFPNSVVTRSIEGDTEYALTFRGDSDKLLYELKNLMAFQKLTQLSMTRLFSNGTVITAWSFVNSITHIAQDFVLVDVRQSRISIAGEEEECTITLINLPTVVTPMRYPNEIRVGEVAGVDYFKTYYTIDIDRCKSCADESISFSFKFPTPNTEHVVGNPTEHCIVSEDGGCFGEVIDHGNDIGGKFFRWKAYTEGSSQDRTGYGYVKLTATIQDAEGTKDICTFEAVIKIDCCQKADPGSPEIYWEPWAEADCSEFITYRGLILCKVPATIPMSDLVWYAAVGGGYFYAVGGCPDYDWTFTGPGQFNVIDSTETDFHWRVRWQPPADGSGVGCYGQASFLVTDRCGRTDTLSVTPCCGNESPLSIGYTSLLMSCGVLQTFTAVGGCEPYTWSLSGGGFLNTGEGSEVIYTAPATNVNCVDNPTITLTDCCGNTASIQLAVNCWNGIEHSLEIVDLIDCDGCWHRDTPDWCEQNGYFLGYAFHHRVWNCDGVLHLDCQTSQCGDPNMIHPVDYTISGSFNCLGVVCPPVNCYTAQCGGPSNPTTCDTIYDSRTPTMKEGGCCPLNPLTGLPY